MSNPDIGRYEIEALIGMDGDELAEYIQSAVIINLRTQSPLPPNVMRSLLTLLAYCGEAEEKDLAVR